MAIFGPKPWVNPFGKMSIFRLFELCVFIVQKGVFWFQNIVKDIFLAYIAWKEKLEKWPFLDRKHGLTDLEKCQFFAHLKFLFLLPRKALFGSKISLIGIFLAYIALKKKVGKMAIFGPKPWVNPLEKCQFFDFLNFSFLQPRKVFFGSRIS